MRFEILFYGHKNIRSNHTRTIEITKESHLTPRGDCIVGVNANGSCSDLPLSIKNKLRDPQSKVVISIFVKDRKFVVRGKGHPRLILSHGEDIVIRKSNFICPRTLAISCDRASDLLPRDMVTMLQDPNTQGKFVISVD